jgi:plasmid stability protein
MGQIVIRQIDDADLDRLRVRARASKTSVEAIAREAIRKEARLTVDEKLAVVRKMQAKFKAAMIPGACQTSGVDLIRDDRDHDH